MCSGWTWLALALVLMDPAHTADPLGAVVHVVPIESSAGNTVRAHFTVAAPNPCPGLTEVCDEGEEHCVVHPTSPPTGTEPAPSWCVRTWQKTVPSNYRATVELGSGVTWDVFLRTQTAARPNPGPLNRPPYVALPPPLRARAGCPRHVRLAHLDLDQDAVRCRFARADRGECQGCTQHSFMELNQDACMLSFSGEASAGQYSLVLMVEDIPPQSTLSSNEAPEPLSCVPVFLSLTVEEASPSGCGAEPVATGLTPPRDTKLTLLPYEQVNLTASFTSALEKVVEIQVVGPPALFSTGLATSDTTRSIGVTWVCAPNTLPPVLPICFSANTVSSQSEPRCLWIHQREMMKLPPGTKLECSDTEMTLLLPVSTLKNISLEDLQLNSPTCPVSYNRTHLTARIPLTRCGTQRVHVGSELVYTNTLHSVHSPSTIDRLPSLLLPLACRIPPGQVKGQYRSVVGEEKTIFGDVDFWLEFSLPDSGRLSSVMHNATFRHLRGSPPSRKARQAVGLTEPSSRVLNPTARSVEQLDLHVMSNSKRDRVELMVDSCVDSVTEDFSEPHLLVGEGCEGSSSIIELLTPDTSFKTYRLNMSDMEIHGSKMFVECTVHLCIPTLPSHKCPDPCLNSSSPSNITQMLFTNTYTVRSGAVNIAPESVPTSGPDPNAAITSQSIELAAASANAPPEAKFMTTVLGITAINIYLQVLLCKCNI